MAKKTYFFNKNASPVGGHSMMSFFWIKIIFNLALLEKERATFQRPLL
jgi:hypothetical protein